MVSGSWLADNFNFKATSQTAFGGQLPYYGILEAGLCELLTADCLKELVVSGSWLADSFKFKATSQTAFGGQLPYYGILEAGLCELLASRRHP